MAAMPIDFTLPDAEDRPFAFDAAFRARRNAMLFFYRGWWWPFCRSQVEGIKALSHELARREIEVLLISADDPESQRRFRKSMNIDAATPDGTPRVTRLLSDVDHAVADRYGIPISRRHPKAWSYRDGFIQPAVFVYGGEEELFRFIQSPGLLNLWGAARRPTPQQVLDAVAPRLDAARAAAGERPT